MLKKIIFMIICLYSSPLIIQAASLKVGDNYYETFDEAIIDANTSKNEIVLLEDISNQKITIKSDYNIIINLNGKTYNYETADIGQAISNSGILKIYGDSNSKINLIGSSLYIFNDENAKLVFDVAEFSIEDDIVNKGYIQFIDGSYKMNISNSGNTQIDGGIFYLNNKNLISNAAANININGGSFINLENSITSNFISSYGTSVIKIKNASIKDNNLSSNSEFLYTSSDDSEIDVDNCEINIKGVVFNVGAGGKKVVLNIKNSKITSDREIVWLHSSDSTLTLGENDDKILDSPKLETIKVDHAIVAALENKGTVINFYDGSFTGLKNPPYNTSGTFNTLPSYNVKDNGNGTFTARLINDTENSNVPEIIPENNNDENNKIVTNNSNEEIENPQTGGKSIIISTLIGVFTIFLIIKKLKNKDKLIKF